MQNITPVNKKDSAISHPKKIAQMTFNTVLNPDVFWAVTSLPNGHNTKPASLKYCIPIGIPIIVMQAIKPISKLQMHQNNPPKTIQIMFPKVFIHTPLSLLATYILIII